jgi:hypothetical protein
MKPDRSGLPDQPRRRQYNHPAIVPIQCDLSAGVAGDSVHASASNGRALVSDIW